MVNGTRDVFLYELRRNLRRKGYLFGTFGIPLLIFMLMFGYNALSSLAQPSPEDLAKQFDFRGIEKAGYVDLSGEFPAVPETLANVLISYPDEAAARTALNAREIDTFYVIHDDYLQTGDITQHVPGLTISLFTPAPIEQLAYSKFLPNADVATLRRLQQPAEFQEFNLEREKSAGAAQNEDADFLMVYVFTFTFLLGLLITNSYLMQSVIEEKENRLIEILITSVRPGELLAGKILALSCLGILQIIVWAGGLILALNAALSLPAFESMTVLNDIQIPLDRLPIMLAYFILGYLFFAAKYGAIGAISNSIREGPSYAAFLTVPAVVPFWFFPMFIATPDAPLPVILSIFPITAPIAMMIRLSVTAVPAIQIIISLAVLALSVAGAMWAAGRIFRVQTLLAGKTPKLRDIPKLLRG
jgi:ABC-2 type transport system permease protein